jgi:hypothetical protein
MVFLQGSGAHARGPSRPYAERLARRGLAGLIYDKRGTGESGGDWTRSPLEDLARDAVAAIEHLRTLPGIDPERIVLWAPSQGAWVATVAAGLTDRIAFAVVISGGGVSPREVEIHGYERALERAGVSEPQRTEARALLDRYFDYLGSGEGREALEQRLEVARRRAWYPLVPLDRVLPSPRDREHWEWVARYDPMPGIARMRFPILLLFGERDEQQPTALALSRWRQGLSAAGNNEVTVKVFPGADHFLRTAPPGHAGDAPHPAEPPPPVEGFWETVEGWLGSQLVLDADARSRDQGAAPPCLGDPARPR